MERSFVYLPLMHSEDIQDHSLANLKFKELIQEGSGKEEYITKYLGGFPFFLAKHTEIIEKFNRYPYRNKVLGRQNTPQEEEYLKAGHDSFGQ
jgi:uncharacterized protein (DUF924 family)